MIGASILASNVGPEHIVELAGTAANSGLVMGHYELHSWIILLLGWVFVPFYMRSMVYTMPEFLERRFNAKSRILLSVIQLLSYVITKASVTIFAAVAEDKRASRLSWNAWDVWLSIIVIALIIAVFVYF